MSFAIKQVRVDGGAWRWAPLGEAAGAGVGDGVCVRCKCLGGGDVVGVGVRVEMREKIIIEA